MSAVIKSIEPGSPAAKKLAVGDEILSVNGGAIADVLDYKYLTYDAELTVAAKTPGGKFRLSRVTKGEGEDLGLEFDTYLMDAPKACKNRCIFCFVDQLPRNMRKTLYFKDDDARLSFLTGNYVTLTNLSERELDRIIALSISPLNISVHAADAKLRARLLGLREDADIMPVLKRLADGGIVMNCQIVCCPGINDGDALSKTMRDLASLYPAVNSVSIVPVGLTKHRDKLPKLTPFDQAAASDTVGQVEAYAEECRKTRGGGIFFCADELYIKAAGGAGSSARREQLSDNIFDILPGGDYYEGYPQLENGVGLLRLFETEFREALKPVSRAIKPFSIATGVSAAPFLTELLNKAKKTVGAFDYDVFPIVNDFFGHTIDVAGLVTGRDIIARLRGKNLKNRLLLPKTMLRDGETCLLDDITLADIERELGVPVAAVETDGAALLREILR